MARGEYKIGSKLFAAGKHPHILVQHAYIECCTKQGEDLDRALDNLAVWLDRCEPGWRTARRLTWWDNVK